MPLPVGGEMARSMKLFLIRHGETVDNVAGLYAGVRDSELTNHGYQQATRLGQHFKALGLSFSHLYSSHLQRAVKTAGKIREGQLAPAGDETPAQLVPDLLQLPLLMEQDFGSMEGKKFFERPADSTMTGRDHHRKDNKSVVGFIDVESKESMARRADAFLAEHLIPLLDSTARASGTCVAIVSHGIFLSTLWKRLLLRLPSKSVTLSAELQATARPSLEHLGGWSNTGYLELLLTRHEPLAEQLPSPSSITPSSPAEMPEVGEGIGKAVIPHTCNEPLVAEKQSGSSKVKVIDEESQSSAPRICSDWRTMILTINGKAHLQGLKRTGGGVGSSRHDASQRSIETFFKRRKVG